MPTRLVAASALAAAAALIIGPVAGCTPTAAKDVAVGDCVQMSGPPDRAETTPAPCGSAESNYTVVAVVSGGGTDIRGCPSDVDSSYSSQNAFSDQSTTICLDVDWVVGGCMSVDADSGQGPYRVNCDDATAPGRQRATEIMRGVANVDQCASGQGYAYDERDFTVCVEDVS
ncbi:hypothetical protein CRI77_05115 [Mycolicibacterium duvalii]|uniref:Uncharacterized protein n=1 Tax=Mycolicibacterium duvalii TaxID=39688 RepID=A0A7I7JZU3_9MYCO|nr:hypothetical protein [Mycolicibacterium duvalii]MCV7367293.1 hypothetical protein [Mycolicibacterium duvalii]PEG43547.1 hypothetical protein CRI77_05115 [Mycolicibacterium duvalii]BBX17337.1 hypothetical protein MDUV_21970 [Mycolicibacterium duvalii]